MFLKILITNISFIFVLSNEVIASDPLKDALGELRNGKITFEAFTSKVKEDTTSHSLLLEKNDLDEPWKIIDLAHALSQNKTLTSLCLNNPNFGSNSETQRVTTVALKGIFKCNDSITKFSLYCDNDFPQQRIGTLMSGFTWYNKTQKLSHVILNHLGITNLDSMSSIINSEFKITHLDLMHNKIDFNGAKDLGEALKKNTTITFLDLDHNQLGDKGAIEIANGLTFNTALKNLYLGYNNIESNGAGAIARSLQVNKSLTRLGINDNPLGEGGIGYFCTLFRNKDSSLNTIWMGNVNNIFIPNHVIFIPTTIPILRTDGYIALANALNKEPNISILRLAYTNLKLDEAQNLNFLLNLNPRITLELSGSSLTQEVKNNLQVLKNNNRITW